MEQPKNDIQLTDDRDMDSRECIVTIEEYEEGDFVWIASGRTPLSAHKAAIRRLKRLLREEERVVAKLEKGGA